MTLRGFTLFVAILAPTAIAAEFTGPILTGTSSEDVSLTVSKAAAVAIGLLELAVLPGAAGALLGWRIGRTRSAAVSTALTGIALAVGPGHNIPFLAGTPVALKGLTIVLSVIVASAITLVGVGAMLSRLEGLWDPAIERRRPEVWFDVS